MKLDLNTYRHSIKPTVKHYMESKPNEDKCYHLTIIAQATHCHIIIIGYFVAELYGMSPELRDRLDFLEKYYDYPTVLNKL